MTESDIELLFMLTDILIFIFDPSQPCSHVMSCHVILVILSWLVVVLSSNHINYVETDLVNSNEMADCLFLRILRVKMSLRNSIFKTC